MVMGRRTKKVGKHSEGTYRLHAALHVAQVLILVIVAMLALVTLSLVVPLLVALVGETLVLTFLPRSRSFRSRVDAQLDRLARARAAAARFAVLERMSEEHRLELGRLERLAARIRARCPVVLGSAAVDHARADDEWPSLGRLLATYVRVAIAHRTHGESFPALEGLELRERAQRLASMRGESAGAKDPLLETRIAIVERRVETWARARREQDALEQGLASIGELVRWMHDECVAHESQPVRAQLEDTLAFWEHDGATLRELCSYVTPSNDTVDVEALGLGHALNDA